MMEIRWQLATSYDVIYAQINFRIQYFIKEIYKLVCVCMCDGGEKVLINNWIKSRDEDSERFDGQCSKKVLSLWVSLSHSCRFHF